MSSRAVLSEEQFLRFRNLIEQRYGIYLDESRKKSFEFNLWGRMEKLGVRQLAQYYELVLADSSEEEFGELINLVTINETFFFRDPAQFRVLHSRILPDLIRERGAQKNHRIRIWSAGCATGEEAYSIAMLLWDMGLYALRDWTFEIVGTDINSEALKAARRGVYSMRAVRNAEGERLARYFVADGEYFRLKDEVKRCVQFRYLNLVQQPSLPADLGGQDFIYCKNVAIYFRRENTRRLMGVLYEALNEGGYLFLGHSESLWQISDQFRLVEYDGSFCYRKVTAPPVVPERRAEDRRHAMVPPAGAERRTSERREPPRLSRRDAGTAPSGRAQGAVTKEKPHEEAAISGKPDHLFDRCFQFFRAGEWERAESSLKELIRSSSTFIPAYLLLSVLYANQVRYEEAIEQARRALKLNALEAKAHLLVGMIEARRGHEEDALQALRRSLYLDNSLALAHFCLGNLYRERGDFGRALREYATVVRDYERHAVEWSDEFAVDLTLEQVVDFCRHSMQLLNPSRRSEIRNLKSKVPVTGFPLKDYR